MMHSRARNQCESAGSIGQEDPIASPVRINEVWSCTRANGAARGPTCRPCTQRNGKHSKHAAWLGQTALAPESPKCCHSPTIQPPAGSPPTRGPRPKEWRAQAPPPHLVALPSAPRAPAHMQIQLLEKNQNGPHALPPPAQVCGTLNQGAQSHHPFNMAASRRSAAGPDLVGGTRHGRGASAKRCRFEQAAKKHTANPTPTISMAA